MDTHKKKIPWFISTIQKPALTHNYFFFKEWQLKLSGIDIVPDGDTEETELDNESPRSPIGAINPLLLQYPQGKATALTP